MIYFKNISKTYTIGNEKVHALHHANLHIREGEFVSIIGPSGSGKSTLMNIMGCIDVADEGSYLLDRVSIEQYSEKMLAKVRNQKIGFIFQNFNLISNLTAEENVELPLIYQGMPAKDRKRRTEEALKQVEIYERKKHLPSQLSGGQQQRVAIARAIATDPALYLADEPTGNLDSQTGKQIMQLFHKLNSQGKTIVLITHDEDIASQTGRKIRICDGRVEEVAE